jgi:iron complex transport system substrate-binding protein
MRIVSLLPSATEMICSLGLGDRLVGVTHECDFPPDVLHLPKVTRTAIPQDVASAEIDALVREQLRTKRALYTLDMPLLESLKPDLIVTQTLCNVCAVAEEDVSAAVCTLPGRPRVINLEPTTLAEVLNCLRRIGEITDAQARAERVIHDLERRVHAVATRAGRLQTRPRVTLLEWIDPLFSCGHWSPELVRIAGGVEGIGQEGRPSRSIHWQEVVSWQPEVLLVACCGFSVERTLRDMPLLRSKPGWEELPCVRSSRVYVVDGSAYFSRPGPRLVDSLEILAHALDPSTHPLPCGLAAAVSV